MYERTPHIDIVAQQHFGERVRRSARARGRAGAVGAARGTDLRVGWAPDGGDVSVPAVGGGLRRAEGMVGLGDAVVRGVAVVEVPDRPWHRPRAGPGRPPPGG